MTNRRPLLLRNRVHLVALAIVASIPAFCSWPGHMSGDTLAQIETVKTGQFTDWHAPLLMALWRIGWNWFGLGPGWVLLATGLTFAAGAYLCLRALLSGWGAAIVAAILIFSPTTLGYLIVHSRDTWYLAFVLLSLGAMTRAFAREERPQAALGWATLSLVAAWLAAAARQNALPAVAVLVIGLAVFLVRRTSVRGQLKLVGAGVAAWLVLLVGIVGTQAVASRAIGVTRLHPEQALMIYDLAVQSERQQRLLLPASIYPRQDLELLASRTTTLDVVPLLFGQDPLVPFPVPAEAFADLRRAWLDMITDTPIAYFRERWRLYTRQAGWSGNTVWIQHPYIDGNRWNYAPERPSLDSMLVRYVNQFARNPQLDGSDIFRLWPWMIPASAVAAWGALRRRRFMPLLAVGAAAAYQASIFMGAMGVQWRFSLPSVVLGQIVLILAVGDWVVGRRRRSEEMAPTARPDTEIREESSAEPAPVGIGTI